MTSVVVLYVQLEIAQNSANCSFFSIFFLPVTYILLVLYTRVGRYYVRVGRCVYSATACISSVSVSRTLRVHFIFHILHVAFIFFAFLS